MSHYHVKEKAFTSYNGIYYESLVRDIRTNGSSKEYLIRYTHFSKHYDEWVPESRMMPHTPQNSEKVKKLYKEALLKEKQRKQAKKKEPVQMEEEQGEESEETSDQTSNEEETSEAPVKKLKRKNYDTSILDSDDGEPLIITKLFIEFSLSQKLKDQLTNDFTMVTQKMLISLPRHPNITAILKGFVLYTSHHFLSDVSMFAQSVQSMFNKFIQPRLLTEFEVTQHHYFDKLLLHNQKDITQSHPHVVNQKNEPVPFPISETSSTFSDIYGGEHLLRFLVQLPKILSTSAEILNPSWRIICREHLEILSQYLDDFHTYIFTAKYLPADELDSDYSMYLQWIHQVESEPDIVEGKT